MFGGQLTVEETKLKIWDFILRNKHTDQNIWEGNLKIHIQSMRKNRVWRSSLGIMVFYDLMRFNISIYTLLDRKEPEIEINHHHNSNIINLLLRIGGI